MTLQMEARNMIWRSLMLGVVALALGLGIADTVQAQAFQTEAKVAKVDAIEITGAEHVERTKILFTLPFSEGEEITLPDELERAELKLRDLGFFQDVAVTYADSAEGGGIVVKVEVFENPVIDEIQVTGNRNWNEHRRIEFLGLSLPWPFVSYLVAPERIFEILKKYEIEKGKVFNTAQFKKALGVDSNGQCLQTPPSPSICNEYSSKGYIFFAIANAEMGKLVRIELLERVIEAVQVNGLESPYKEEAEALLKSIPLDKPIKLPDIQTPLQSLAQSVYFLPFSDKDLTLGIGSALDKIVLGVNLKVNQLLDEPVAIERIEFTGNKLFSAAELESKVELEPGTFDNYAALKAISGVHRFYLKEGYVMAKVIKEKVEHGVLTLRTNEGLISEIEIQQNSYTTAILRQDQPLELVPLPENAQPIITEPRNNATPPPAQDEHDHSEQTGSPDDPSGLEEHAHDNEPIAPILGDNDSPAVKILQAFSDFLGDLLGTTASSGLPFTAPKIIAKELTIKPGGYLNQFLLAETYRRLLALGYFKDVLFDFEPLPAGEIKVKVNVIEQDKLGDFRFGGTFSQEGLVGQLSLRSKNLHGTGQDVAVQLDRGITGKSIVTWSLDYQNRTILEGADYLSMKLFNKSSKETSPRPHLLNRIGGEASLAYPFREMQLVLGLRHEFFTKEFDDDQQPEIEKGTSNVLSLTVNRDGRNNPLFPTRGGSQSLKLERAGIFAGSEKFTRAQMTLIHHIPTFEDQNIAFRLFGGWGQDLPSQEQFYLGGSMSVRGIEPKNTSTLAFLNAEYRILVEPNFSLAFFADMGTDFGGPLDLISLKKSVGIEGRVTIPYVGPIRVAFAWPVTDKLEYFKVEFGFGTLF